MPWRTDVARSRRMPGARQPRPPVWVFLAALAFLLYYGLVVTADLFRPGPSGLHVQFGGHGAEVVAVARGSPAEAAGLRPGDRILRIAGRAVSTSPDWFAVHANLLADRLVPLDVERGGVRLTATLVRPRQPLGVTTVQSETMALLVALAVQLICLVLAVVVAFRRPTDRLALLASWLLASFGVFTVLLPYGFGHFWRLVPLPLHPLLWFAYVSSFVAPVIFFAFCAEFPRSLFRQPRLLLALCAPAVLIAGWHAYFAYVIVYREARITTGADWSRPLALLTVGYILAGLVVLSVQYWRLDQVADRRRLRVLLAGASVGFAGGGLVTALVWVGRNPQVTSSLFASPITLVAVPLLVALPASIAYTILRQRLFGVGVILRQGVRHALARRLLLSLVPVVLAAVALDLYLHEDQAIGTIVRMRAWRYALAGGGLLALILNRRRWLAALDRRFFHEHYRAEQILQEIAERLRQTSDPEAAVAAVVQQVDRALRPVFAGALGRRSSDAALDVLTATASFPEGLRLGRDSRLLAMARAIGRPLDLSPDQDTWIARHLSPAEASLVYETQLELLVPVTSSPTGDVMIALGPRRSEEPYSRRDVDLLGAIAANLALLLEHAGPVAREEPGLAECPKCGTCLDTSHARCPRDGALLLATGIPPVLGGRYVLRSRLGAGGMGTVYSAQDEALGRVVAIKVLAEHLVGSTDAAQRFQREAQTAAGFTHAQVVTIHDVGVTAGNRAFLVMEQLEGCTLGEQLDRHGALDRSRALAIVSDVCNVLTVAHGIGLVHRDLKPENIFLARSGGSITTKVLDFGIAKVLADASGPAGGGTDSGRLMGTLPYMPPEQLRGEPVHPMWDLWALGVLSVEMLTGARGRGSQSGDQRPLPTGLTTFFAGALSPDRRQRPATAQEFSLRFADALESPD